MTLSQPSGRNAVPRGALVLGLGGLLPFMGGALAMGLTPGAKGLAAFALVSYGAVILSFLGGIRWGFLVLSESEAGPWNYGLSVVPSLVAWAATLFSLRAGLLVLSGALILWFAAEAAVPLAGIPRWYVRLRALLTMLASGSLLTASLLW